MSTRKIKDAKDLSTNELIYFKGHAQATYMSDGRTVEEAVSEMSGGSGSGAYPVVELMDINGVSLDPNTYYKFTFDDGIFVNLTITLNESINNDIVNEYIFELNLPPSTWVIPIVSLPDTIKFVNNVYPEFEMGKTYIISIVNNYAVFAEFSNGDEIIGGGAA